MFLYGERKPLSNELAADQIGKFFPEVGDKLVNTLQLTKTLDRNQKRIAFSFHQTEVRTVGIFKIC